MECALGRIRCWGVVLLLLSGVAAETVRGALVSQWKLDGNLIDSAGASHGSQIDGPLVYIPGAVRAADPGGLAGQFDGAVRLNVGHDPSLQPAGAISITAWIKVQRQLTDYWQHIYRREGAGNTRELVAVGTWAGSAGVWFGVGTTSGYAEPVGAVSDARMRDGNWHLVAATYDSSVSDGDNIFIYWDGAAAGSARWSGAMDTNNANDAMIGGRANGNETFVGGIDDVRVYDHALSSEEVQRLFDKEGAVVCSKATAAVAEGGATDQYTLALAGPVPSADVVVTMNHDAHLIVAPSQVTFHNNDYTTPRTVTIAAADDGGIEGTHVSTITHTVTGDPFYAGITVSDVVVTIADNDVPPDLIAHWKLDGDLTDTTGHGHDGMAVGGPLTYVVGAPNGCDAGGQAVDFDGSTQGVEVPHHPDLKPPSITVCAWIRQDVYTAHWQNIVRKEDGGGGRYLLEVGEEGPVNGIYCGFVINGSYYEKGAAVAPSVLADGNWHHAATTYDGSFIRIYFDGGQIGAWPQPGVLSAAGTAPLEIGRHVSEAFDGAVDDVRVYSRALSETEIAQLATGTTASARGPQPADGAAGVSRIPTLGWLAGDGALLHCMYFGADYDEVNNAVDPDLPPVGKGTLPAATETYLPDANPLQFAATYYWRVDEVNANGVVKGQVWRFTVMNKPIPFLPGDLNLDSQVSLPDLAILTEYWLQEPVCQDVSCPDLGGSGQVDMVDFSLMADNWGKRIEPLSITEFMASNGDTLADGDGHYSDWIELCNTSGGVIDLAGWYLTDDTKNLTRWRFPEGAVIDGKSCLVVFASGRETDNYVDPSGHFHTNFRLSASGGYLALVRPDGQTIAHQYVSAELDSNEGLRGYPHQETNVSYGLYENAERYFGVPSPGAANDNPFLGFVQDTTFDHDRGFYDVPFAVTIRCQTRGAVIRYTTDGSEPGPESMLYSDPIPINTTTCLRAKAFKPNWLPSNTDTQTYIFPADVIRQAANPAGFPGTWNGTTADYQMAPDIVDVYRNTIVEDLKTITSVSIVADGDDLFGGNGIYANPTQEGFAWERPCSLELIQPDASEGFQVDCGVRIQGGGGRGQDYRKHGFRALFKSIYGPAALRYKLFPDSQADRFDTIIFKCGTDVTWIDPREYLRVHALYVRDSWCRNTERDMGLLTTHGRFVHLYVNGLYWGLYEMMERPDAAFMAGYLGGAKGDYDSINQSEVIDGDRQAWDAAITAANAGAARAYDNTWYLNMQNWIDVDNLCDFMLNQFYSGNIDWAGGNGNNWRVASVRIRDSGGNPTRANFSSFIWDAEHTLADGFTSDDPYWDAIANFNDRDGTPARFFGTLRNNAEFVMRFADHAHKHLFNDGALTVAEATRRFVSGCSEIDRAIVGESARWGDLRQTPSYTPADWSAERDRLLGDYFPYRTAVLIDHLRNHRLYPAIDAPVFSQHGGYVPVGFQLTMSGPGTIMYTLDGSDPRQFGGAVASGAAVYSGPIMLAETTRLRARVKNGDEWSALNEAVFAIPTAEENLRITELMYHPAAGGGYNDEDFEFIELEHVGPAGEAPINLNLIRFTNGVQYTFDDSVSLDPGDYVVVYRNEAAFDARYPDFVGRKAGPYLGSLNNDGERILLQDPLGTTIHDFSYSNRWYQVTDGPGFSLTIRNPLSSDPADWGRKNGWRASFAVGGSPGTDDSAFVLPAGAVVINELLANSDTTAGGWIELYNTTDEPINLGGWFLSDDSDDLKKYEIDDDLILPAHGYRVFNEDTHFGNLSDPGARTPFAFTQTGGSACLTSGSGGEITGVFSAWEDFGASEQGVAFGRYVKSQLDGGVNFVAMSANTPGDENACPRVGPIVINEISYHPRSNGNAEYVELLNISGSDVVLSAAGDPDASWRLVDDPQGPELDYRFPSNVSLTLRAGKYVLLVKDLDAFTVVFGGPSGPDLQAVLVWTDVDAGSLSNGGEKLELQKPLQGNPGFYVRVDRVNYDDDYPWPTAPDGLDGNGSDDTVLGRISAGAYGNDAVNWRADAPTPGRSNGP